MPSFSDIRDFLFGSKMLRKASGEDKKKKEPPPAEPGMSQKEMMKMNEDQARKMRERRKSKAVQDAVIGRGSY